MASGRQARASEGILAPTTAEIQAFFERVATDWDTMLLAYYDESVIGPVSLRSGIAAGLAPRVRWVSGVDSSPAVLHAAPNNPESPEGENLDLIESNLSGMPLAGGSMDNALANTNIVLHHADVWPGFTQGQVEGYFGESGLVDYGYESLGMQ